MSDDSLMIASWFPPPLFWSQVERVRKRRYRLRESALEVFLRRGKRRSLFVDFGPESRDQGRRNDFIRALETRVGALLGCLLKANEVYGSAAVGCAAGAAFLWCVLF